MDQYGASSWLIGVGCRGGPAAPLLVWGSAGLIWNSGGWFMRLVHEVGVQAGSGFRRAGMGFRRLVQELCSGGWFGEDLQGRKRQAAG